MFGIDSTPHLLHPCSGNVFFKFNEEHFETLEDFFAFKVTLRDYGLSTEQYFKGLDCRVHSKFENGDHSVMETDQLQSNNPVPRGTEPPKVARSKSGVTKKSGGRKTNGSKSGGRNSGGRNSGRNSEHPVVSRFSAIQAAIATRRMENIAQ